MEPFDSLVVNGDGVYNFLAAGKFSNDLPSNNLRFLDAGGDGVVIVDFEIAIFFARSSSLFVTGDISLKLLALSDKRFVRIFD